jgi:aryl-alcohol dehydrogenase-like predicted oxidoreductase
MHSTATALRLGQSDLTVAPLGIGAWAWGDSGFWGYGKDYGRQDVNEAFVAGLNAGVNLVDTAEVYGWGESERILGTLISTTRSRERVVIATKFAPFVWRLTEQTVAPALHASLRRLGVAQIDLYQVHWPFSLLSIRRLMDALADAVQEGTIRAVGVSNYSAEQMQRAHEALARRGVPLATNQVNYSLLKRSPEVNGVLDTCRQLDVTLIAYSPLAQGLLTGKYSAQQRPAGPRAFTFGLTDMALLERVLDLLREIGKDHDDKTPAQVALNWLIGQGNVLPIPGAKHAAQAMSNAGALGWALSDDERAAIADATLPWQR